MDYLLFVLIGLIATALGYGFGWSLDLWEKTDRSKQDRSVLYVLLFLIGTALVALSGLAFLLLQFWLIRLATAAVLLLVGFRFGHPLAPKRLRQVTRTFRGITHSTED